MTVFKKCLLMFSFGIAVTAGVGSASFAAESGEGGEGEGPGCHRHYVCNSGFMGMNQQYGYCGAPNCSNHGYGQGLCVDALADCNARDGDFIFLTLEEVGCTWPN